MKFFIILSLSVLFGRIYADEASLKQTIKNENELIENVKTEWENGYKTIFEPAKSKLDSLNAPFYEKLKSFIGGKFRESKGQGALKKTEDIYRFNINRAFGEMSKIIKAKSEVYTSYLKYDEFVKKNIKRIIEETINLKSCKKQDNFAQFTTNAEETVKRISKCAIDSFSSISLEPEGVNVIVSSIEEITKNIDSEAESCNTQDKICLLRILYNTSKSFSILWVKIDDFYLPYVELATKKQDTVKCIFNEMESFYDIVKDAHLDCSNK